MGSLRVTVYGPRLQPSLIPVYLQHTTMPLYEQNVRYNVFTTTFTLQLLHFDVYTPLAVTTVSQALLPDSNRVSIRVVVWDWAWLYPRSRCPP